MAPLRESDYCFNHDPAVGRQRATARKKGGRNRRTKKAARICKPLRSVGAVMEVLEGAVADTVVQENSAQRSHTLGYLAGVLLKALEIGELEDRVCALEKAFGESE